MIRSLALLALAAAAYAQQNTTQSAAQQWNTSISDNAASISYSPAVNGSCQFTQNPVSFCTGGSWNTRFGQAATGFSDDVVHTSCNDPGAQVLLTFTDDRIYLNTTHSSIGSLVNISIDNTFSQIIDTNGTEEHFVWASPELDWNATHTFVATTLPPPAGSDSFSCFDVDNFVVTSNSTQVVAPAPATGGGVNKGAIAGGVVGGLVALLALGLGVWWFKRRRNPFGKRDVIDDAEFVSVEHRVTPFVSAAPSAVAPSTSGSSPTSTRAMPRSPGLSYFDGMQSRYASTSASRSARVSHAESLATPATAHAADMANGSYGPEASTAASRYSQMSTTLLAVGEVPEPSMVRTHSSSGSRFSELSPVLPPIGGSEPLFNPYSSEGSSSDRSEERQSTADSTRPLASGSKGFMPQSGPSDGYYHYVTNGADAPPQYER